MKAVVIVAVLASAAHAEPLPALEPRGPLFATEDGGKLIIHQLAGDAVTTVYEEPNTGVLEYAFSDPSTLWVLRVKQGKFSVGAIAGGKAGPERVLTYKDWDGRKGPAWPPHLVIGKQGVWVTRCVDRPKQTDEVDELDVGLGPGRAMCTNVYRRVDAEAPLADSLDSEVIAAHWQQRWPHGTRKTAPKGYTVSTDRGFVCKGPRNKMTIALGTRWAQDDGYVSDDPIILRFTVGIARGGKPMPFMGHDDYYAAKDLANDDGTGTFFVEDCKTHLRAVIAIGDGAIATTEGDAQWKLRRGAKQLATFTATRVVAP